MRNLLLFSSFRFPQQLGLRDKLRLKPHVREAESLIAHYELILKTIGAAKTSQGALRQPELPAKRKLSSGKATSKQPSVFPSLAASAAMAEVEDLKAEYIRLSLEITTFTRMPAFLHRKYPPVDEFLTLLVYFQDAVLAKDDQKVVETANEASKAFTAAQQKAGSEHGADFIWECEEGSQISSKIATLHKQAKLAKTGTPEADSSSEMMAQTLAALAGLLGGIESMQERLAIESSKKQIGPPAPSLG